MDSLRLLLHTPFFQKREQTPALWATGARPRLFQLADLPVAIAALEHAFCAWARRFAVRPFHHQALAGAAFHLTTVSVWLRSSFVCVVCRIDGDFRLLNVI